MHVNMFLVRICPMSFHTIKVLKYTSTEYAVEFQKNNNLEVRLTLFKLFPQVVPLLFLV